MLGRCCSRPRPMCGVSPMPTMPMHSAGMGMMPATNAGLPRPVIPIGGGCQITQNPHPQVVVEPPLIAAPNTFHHHQSVQHVQPVITQDVHHLHCHHKYVVQEQRQAAEVLKHTHGLCGPAMTQPATPCGVR